MSEGYDDFKLKELMFALSDQAKECNIEVRLFGGLLKFTPIGNYGKVLLELAQADFHDDIVIYKHKNQRLTDEFKGRKVSEKWIIGFLTNNSEIGKQFSLGTQSSNESYSPYTKPRKNIFDQIKEESERRAITRSVFCSVCGGDGGATGNCFKCGGNGLA